MALSTVTISDTQEWAKKLSFNRLSSIGNNLEPALTSANMVIQTILGPPFTWWWNTQEIGFTCSTTPNVSSAISHVSITSNIVTLTVNNTFAVGDIVLASGLVTATFLNGQLLVIVTASGTRVTAQFLYTGTYDAAETVGVLTNQTTQDYSISVPLFSHIEHASVLDINATPPKWFALQVNDSLGLDSTLARPTFIGPHVEDDQGNVTFRVMPAPAANYPVSIHVQLAPPQITSINQTWAPMPDYMQYVYSWGFLSLMWAFADDARFPIANQKFTSGLLARADGITEEDRNIFLANWDSLTTRQVIKTQQGIQARGV